MKRIFVKVATITILVLFITTQLSMPLYSQQEPLVAQENFSTDVNPLATGEGKVTSSSPSTTHVPFVTESETTPTLIPANSHTSLKADTSSPSATPQASLNNAITFEDFFTIMGRAFSGIIDWLTKKPYVKKLQKTAYQGSERIRIEIENTKTSESTVTLYNPNGEEVAIETQLVQAINPTIIDILPPAQFIPGKYRIKIEDPEKRVHYQEFMWGVLAINTQKSSYHVGEEVFIAMAVLDDVGEMVCNAEVILEVTAPNKQKTTFTTKAGTIIINPQCTSKDFTLIPDYQATYTPTQEGEHYIKLTATTKNGTFTTTDSFNVTNNEPFTIKRHTATRIYPLHSYPVTFTLTAKKDFNGIIREYLPASFSVSQASDEAVIKFSAITKVSKDTHVASMEGAMFALNKPFNSNYPLMLGFGKEHGDELVAKKYATYGVIGHDGADFAMPVGTPVLAADDGEVVRADSQGDYGVTIVIQHSWGRSYYGQLDKILAGKGQRVKKGELIALSGKSGLSSDTPPHLHFGIKPKDSDVENGYYGKVNPLPFIGIADNGNKFGLVKGIDTGKPNTSTQQQVVEWHISLKAGEEATFGYRYQAPLISPELYLIGPLSLVDENGNERMRESRNWQIAADSVVVNGGIVSSEAQFGGLQRKVAYVPGSANRWVTVTNDNTDVQLHSSPDGENWSYEITLTGNIDQALDNDADNYNPALSVDTANDDVYIAFVDDSADRVEIIAVSWDINSDGFLLYNGATCGLPSPGALSAGTYMVSIAAYNGGAVVAYSDTSTGAYFGIYDVKNITTSCITTNITTGNITFGSGLTASDRPVVFTVSSDGKQIGVVFNDGDLSYSQYDTDLGEWTINNQTIASVADVVYSAVSDKATSPKIWVLSDDALNSTDTNFYTLNNSANQDFASTQIDADAGANDNDGDMDISIFCPTSDNCKIVYTDDFDTAAPKLIFVDCNDEACSAPTVTTLDIDLGAAGDHAGASIYCPTSDDCKIVYADDLNTNNADITFVDCPNEACTGATFTDVDTDISSGTGTALAHTSIFCPTATNCKFVYNDESLQDIFFVDCPDAVCGATGRVITSLDTVYGSTGTSAPWNDIYCVASDNCKVVYHDNNATDGCADANAVCFVDCVADEDCSTNAKTVIDSDGGTTQGATPVDIDCVGGDADCKVVYGDGTAGDLYFVDCADATCTAAGGRTITQIDAVGGANGSLFYKVALSCVSATDCKTFYVGDTTSGSQDAYFIDCDNALCTSGSAYDLPQSRFGGALQCLTSTNCKFAYYNGTTLTNPTVMFADCDTSNCFPTATDDPDPWSTVSTVTSVTLTYDSTNSDLIANIVKDATNQQAYYKVSDATTISWASETAYDFTPGAMEHISSPETVSGTSQMGVLVKLGSNIEFDKFAAQVTGPTMDQILRHGKWFNNGSRQPFTF